MKQPSSLDANVKSCDGQNDMKNIIPTQLLELSPCMELLSPENAVNLYNDHNYLTFHIGVELKS